jgi:nucleoside-diphosphate-sugar epimerase
VSRVLVTGGADALGAAVVRRLLRDARFEVRVFDQRPAPQWMRESCEIRGGDPRSLTEAREAAASCRHVIHLGAVTGRPGALDELPYTLSELDAAMTASVLRAALDHAVERFVYISSDRVFARAEVFPTPEAHLDECPAPRSAFGRVKLAGEALCRAAHAENELPFTICRPFDPYGPPALPDAGGSRAHEIDALLDQALAGADEITVRGTGRETRTPTHVDDLAEGIVAAMAAPAAAGEDFNLAGADELTLARLAELAWEAAGRDPSTFSLARADPPELPVERRWGSAEKARRVLSWQPRIGIRKGLAATAESRREHSAAPAR